MVAMNQPWPRRQRARFFNDDLDVAQISDEAMQAASEHAKQMLSVTQANALAQGNAAAAMTLADMDMHFSAAEIELADAFARQRGVSWGRAIAAMLPTLAGIVLAVAIITVISVLIVTKTGIGINQ